MNFSKHSNGGFADKSCVEIEMSPTIMMLANKLSRFETSSFQYLSLPLAANWKSSIIITKLSLFSACSEG